MPRKSPKLLTREQDQLLRSELLRLAAELQPITVRGLYYQSVTSALLHFITKDKDKSTTNYDLVQRRVLDMRKAGEMPWDWVVDESRASYGINRWDSPAQFADTAHFLYSLDLWRDQSVRPVVMVEKAGQIPVYLQHARKFGVDVVACKGYGSASHLRSVALDLDTHIRNGQHIQLLVCADFDPSGDDWPRAALEEIHSHVSYEDMVEMQRVLVTVDDLSSFGSAVAFRAPNPSDSRTKRFMERYGFSPDDEVCVEMDAMSPAVARQRIEDIVLSLFDGDIHAEQELQAEHRERITAALVGLT